MRPLFTKADAEAFKVQIARLREDERVRRERAEAEAAAREAAERAAFVGDCFTCRDTGFLPSRLTTCDCARGQAIADERHQRQVAAILDAAHIPPRCAAFTLDSYPSRQIAAYRDLRAFLRVWDGSQSLVLKGEWGTGKTGLLISALRDAAAQMASRASARPIHFTTGADLMDAMRPGHEDAAQAATLARAKSVALLGIDDLGAEKPSEWVIERLFVIINARYEAQLPTWVTTNYGLEDLADRIGPRSLERLMETSRVITVDGPNLRRRPQPQQQHAPTGGK